MKEKAQEALDKVKIFIMTKKETTFIQAVIFNLVHKFTDEVPTAATNGITITYNPEFFLSLSHEERAFLVCHEAWHVALQHIVRSASLKTAYEKQIFNHAADYVINILVKDMGLPMPKEGLYDEKYTGMSTEEVYKLIYEEQQGQGGGDMQAPEGFGNDIQEPNTPEELEETKNKVTEILVRAANQAAISNDAGSIPIEVHRLIEDLINPKLSWKELLLRFVNDKSKDDYSWRKPNRRYMPDFYLPSAHSESISHLTIAIDTSGSISQEQLQSILSEINYINQTVKPTNLTIIDCDYVIHNVYEIDSYTDILSLKFEGGGGTSVHPVLDYCNENSTNVLIYFTDLYVDIPEDSPDYPILWIVYDNDDVAPIGETVHVDLEEL